MFMRQFFFQDGKNETKPPCFGLVRSFVETQIAQANDVQKELSGLNL